MEKTIRLRNPIRLRLDNLTTEILALKSNMAQNIIEIGKRLIEVKESLPHGEFGVYLEEKVDFSNRTAQRFMKLFTEFSNTTTLSDIEPSKLITLLEIPKNSRDKFIENNDIKNMSCRQLKQAIKDAKKPRNKLLVPLKVEVDTITPPKIEAPHITVNDKESVIEIIESESKTIIDTEKILKQVDDLIEEITIRRGSFDTSSGWQGDVSCDNRGGVLAQLYATDAITAEELTETVKAHYIDLQINFKELADGTLKENYLKNISNSYNNYGNGERYFDVVESKDLSYSHTTDFTSWIDDEMKIDFIKSYKAKLDNLEMLVGYDENGDSNLCIYNDEKLIGHYFLGDKWSPINLEDTNSLYKEIKKLAEFDNLELVELHNKWIKQFSSYYKREQKRITIENKERVKRQKYREKKEAFENKYNNITTYKFEDIFDENCMIKDVKKNRDNDKQYLDYLTRDRDNTYGNYNFSGLFGNTVAIKEEEKPLYKKFYKTLALAYHPDKYGGTGAEMKVINEMKIKWGI